MQAHVAVKGPRGDVPLPVEAEETSARGLVIAPKTLGGNTSAPVEGEYYVIHAPTGHLVHAPILRGLIVERDVLHRVVTKAAELGLRDWTEVTRENYTKDQISLWLRAIQETWEGLPQETREEIEARWDREDEDW